MKILVTGATGYLGRHLVPALQKLGHEVTGIGSESCDLMRDHSLERFDEAYDQIWHLAAWTQAGDFCLRHPGDQWVINQRINTNVLDWWRLQQPQAKLVAIGTSCSYAPGEELTEESYLLGEPVAELYAYAMSKRMLLVGLRALSTQYKLKYLCLVPSTLFGPGYHAGGKQLHFIFDLIRKIARGKLYGETVTLWGDGNQNRELIFIRDFVNAAVRLSVAANNEIVNIGGGQEFSIRWYAERISEIVDFDAREIRYDTARYTGVRSKRLSIVKLQSLLPDFQLTPFRNALEETVQWYLDVLKSSVDQACQ